MWRTWCRPVSPLCFLWFNLSEFIGALLSTPLALIVLYASSLLLHGFPWVPRGRYLMDTSLLELFYPPIRTHLFIFPIWFGHTRKQDYFYFHFYITPTSKTPVDGWLHAEGIDAWRSVTKTWVFNSSLKNSGEMSRSLPVCNVWLWISTSVSIRCRRKPLWEWLHKALICEDSRICMCFSR